MSKFRRLKPQIYGVEAVVLTLTPPVQFSYLGVSENFKPHKARQEVIRQLKKIIHCRILTDGVCQEWLSHSLLEHRSDEVPTMVVFFDRTHEARYARLIVVVHQLAQSVQGPALPY